MAIEGSHRSSLGGKTVKAAVLTAPGWFEAGRREISPLEAGDVELQVGYVGICGSDLSAYEDPEAPGARPVVLGHEFSAQVVRLGSSVDGLREGQWVSVAPLLSCGDCEFCRTGSDYLCEERLIFGRDLDGALREKLVMPARAVFPLPEGLSPEAGILTEPLAVAVHAVNRGGRSPDGTQVVISGAGAIGLLIAHVVAERGARQVLLLDVDDRRLHLAREMGFEAAQPGNTASAADLLFVATAAREALIDVPTVLSPCGTAVVVGQIREVPLNWRALLMKEGSVTTSRYFNFSDFQEGVRLLATGAVQTSSLIQDQASFSELVSGGGHAVMERAREAVRLLVKMD
jgi:2-desacetyl-2-hydroxyethyl bacteriochlorophyllide A dehydrogenase